jgi:hypothetical protein
VEFRPAEIELGRQVRSVRHNFLPDPSQQTIQRAAPFSSLLQRPAMADLPDSFLGHLPDTGRSKADRRRSGRALAGLLPPAGASCTRLRFKAAIKSTAGAGVEICRGLIAKPFALASISSRNAS